MNKVFSVVILVCSIVLLSYGHGFVNESSYYGGFNYNCKHNPVKAWGYDYRNSTLTIQIGNKEYESVFPEYLLDSIPRNKKLSSEGCDMVKQGLTYNGKK